MIASGDSPPVCNSASCSSPKFEWTALQCRMKLHFTFETGKLRKFRRKVKQQKDHYQNKSQVNEEQSVMISAHRLWASRSSTTTFAHASVKRWKNEKSFCPPNRRENTAGAGRCPVSPTSKLAIKAFRCNSRFRSSGRWWLIRDQPDEPVKRRSAVRNSCEDSCFPSYPLVGDLECEWGWPIKNEEQ